jgi:hypothetical protein
VGAIPRLTRWTHVKARSLWVLKVLTCGAPGQRPILVHAVRVHETEQWVPLVSAMMRVRIESLGRAKTER